MYIHIMKLIPEYDEILSCVSFGIDLCFAGEKFIKSIVCLS